jgi:hypothetical protein
MLRISFTSSSNLGVTVYVYLYLSICIYLLQLKDVKFLFAKYSFLNLMLLKKREKSTYVINVSFYKSSKLILCTKVMKNLVYLFTKSQFVVGQLPPTFLILFLSTCR